MAACLVRIRGPAHLIGAMHTLSVLADGEDEAYGFASGSGISFGKRYVLTSASLLRPLLAPTHSDLRPGVAIQLFDAASGVYQPLHFERIISPSGAAAILPLLLANAGWDRAKNANLADAAVLINPASNALATGPPLASIAKVGSPCVIVGSPFGVYGSDIFRDTMSRGILGAVYPADGNPVLYITDCPCAPGTSGAPVFDLHGALLGMVLPSVVRVDGLAVGLTLVLPWGQISPLLPSMVVNQQAHSALASSVEDLEAALGATILILAGGNYGTGIIVDRDLGLVVTNAHVVNGATKLRGRGGREKAVWFDLAVVFLSTGVPDIALLKVRPQDLHVLKDCRELKMAERHLAEKLEAGHHGAEAYVLGFPLFSPGVFSRPILSSGTLNCRKTRGSQSRPGLIVTTAPVHPGNSGGPIVSKSGLLLGFVTSFSQCETGNAEIVGHPRLNYGVPVSLISEQIHAFCTTGDAMILHDMIVTDVDVLRLWEFAEQAPSSSSVVSKL